MKKIAIIPARGGSKRIPRKNIKEFNGKPIIAYSIKAALDSGLFDEVMVTTDDIEIAEIAISYGANVPFMRSKETANDYATTTEAVIEVLECYKNMQTEFDVVCCIYATAPFVTSTRIVEAFDLMQKSDYESVFTVAAFSQPIQRALKSENKCLKSIWPEYKNVRSQDLPVSYYDAGQFYFSTVEALLKNMSFWGEYTGGLVLSELEVQDLDTMDDWKLAEMKYTLLHYEEDNI